MKLQYCLMLLLCFFINAHAQRLSIGDKVPDVPVHNIFNYDTAQTKLSAFNNKLLILDFMGTNCSSCIKVLPEFKILQEKFHDKTQIVLVTNQKANLVKLFLKLHPELPFPFIAEDTVLHTLFPHTFISHEVWIKDGVVKAITIPEYVKEENIAKLLAGDKIKWPVKNDIADYDYSKPLVTGRKNYTVILDHLPDVPPRFTETKEKNFIRLSIINHPIIDLYLISRKEFNFPTSHILLQVKNKTRLVFNPAMYPDVWMRDNSYCFESVLPLTTPNEKRQQLMAQAIDKQFHIHGRFEKRKVECLVLKRFDSLAAPPSYAAVPNLKKVSLDQLVYTLNHTLYGMPVLDETGLDKHVRIFLDENFASNIEDLKQALKKYGLELSCEIKVQDMFIIKN